MAATARGGCRETERRHPSTGKEAKGAGEKHPAQGEERKGAERDGNEGKATETREETKKGTQKRKRSMSPRTKNPEVHGKDAENVTQNEGP